MARPHSGIVDTSMSTETTSGPSAVPWPPLLIAAVLVGGWLAGSDLLLHLGVVLAIFGFLLAWAL